MKKYIEYFKYIIRHKWYVMVECFKKGLFWRGIMHDMSKFRLSEFIPYARYFYGEWDRNYKTLENGINCYTCKNLMYGSQCGLNGAGIGDGVVAEVYKCKEYKKDISQAISIVMSEARKIEKDFNIAWLKHIHRNPHHWQYWILQEDSGNKILIEMPRKYIDEMICDWNGASKAITGKVNTREWYLKNKQFIQLHPKTRFQVEEYLEFLNNK